MVIPVEEKLVHSVRLSSVGPSRVTGTDVLHGLSPMDLAMKLHYLRAVYYFSSQAAEAVMIRGIKDAMFDWFNVYYRVCGRFKRSQETGRPYIKCNDCGVRFIEAKCEKTVDEWLELLQENCELRKLLVYDQVIGPELSFSPPFLIQVTQFKCGGMSLGLSWAHVLGDAISTVDCINMWGRYMVGLEANVPMPLNPKPISTTTAEKTSPKVGPGPFSLKQVDPVGDHWTYINGSGCSMGTYTFHMRSSQLNLVKSKLFKSDQIPLFEFLCAIIWKCVAEVRGGEEPNVVTLCKNYASSKRVDADGVLSNSQRISVVKAEFPVLDSNPSQLLNLLVNGAVEENEHIEEVVEGEGDFIVYGANLTFVDLGEAAFYELQLNGLNPIFVDYCIQGVGNEGVVVVAPGPETGDGRVVTVVVPEDQMHELKNKLKQKELVVENTII